MEALASLPIAIDCVLQNHFVASHISAIHVRKLVDDVVRMNDSFEGSELETGLRLIDLVFAVVISLKPEANYVVLDLVVWDGLVTSFDSVGGK